MDDKELNNIEDSSNFEDVIDNSDIDNDKNNNTNKDINQEEIDSYEDETEEEKKLFNLKEFVLIFTGGMFVIIVGLMIFIKVNNFQILNGDTPNLNSKKIQTIQSSSFE